jgi:hypothetical protein
MLRRQEGELNVNDTDADAKYFLLRHSRPYQPAT